MGVIAHIDAFVVATALFQREIDDAFALDDHLRLFCSGKREQLSRDTYSQQFVPANKETMVKRIQERVLVAVDIAELLFVYGVKANESTNRQKCCSWRMVLLRPTPNMCMRRRLEAQQGDAAYGLPSFHRMFFRENDCVCAGGGGIL